ncbi:MAG: VCBS repeat-containing protein, partial [Rhodospirillales bacterium]|nr:VCBS repeat-containing protein [Rhodospirillales bacterium]
MSFSSPKRHAFDRQRTPRAALLSGLVLALGLFANGEARAALASSATYGLESATAASAGGRASSTSYSLLSTVGQSSPLGSAGSTSYAMFPGFLSTLDTDGDGTPDGFDAFPTDPTETTDTDSDGIGNNADTDDDGDGIPDAYEDTIAGLDPLDPADATGDIDGDGFTNLEEYLVGTDPEDALSFPMYVVDFNGDAKSDILWRNSSNGKLVLWQMDGFTLQTAETIPAPSASWYIADLGDFDGDNRTDILWRNGASSAVVIWFMDGSTHTSGGSLANVSSSWDVAGLGDFNGDGSLDILWRNNTTGSNVIWEM